MKNFEVTFASAIFALRNVSGVAEAQHHSERRRANRNGQRPEAEVLRKRRYINRTERFNMFNAFKLVSYGKKNNTQRALRSV